MPRNHYAELSLAVQMAAYGGVKGIMEADEENAQLRADLAAARADNARLAGQVNLLREFVLNAHNSWHGALLSMESCRRGLCYLWFEIEDLAATAPTPGAETTGADERCRVAMRVADAATARWDDTAHYMNCRQTYVASCAQCRDLAEEEDAAIEQYRALAQRVGRGSHEAV